MALGNTSLERGSVVYYLEGRPDEFGQVVPAGKPLHVAGEGHESLWDDCKLWWVDDLDDVEVRDGEASTACYLVREDQLVTSWR